MCHEEMLQFRQISARTTFKLQQYGAPLGRDTDITDSRVTQQAERQRGSLRLSFLSNRTKICLATARCATERKKETSYQKAVKEHVGSYCDAVLVAIGLFMGLGLG